MSTSFTPDIGPLPDATRPGVTHELDIYEQGGQLFIKVSLAAPTGRDQAYCEDRTPYTASITASLRVSAEQLKSIEQAMADARRRIGA